FKLAVHAVRARVDQQLRRVKPVPLRRLPRAMNAKTVVHARTPSGQVTVPDIPCTRRQIVAVLVAFPVKHTEFYPLRMRGKEREIHPLPVNARPERFGFPCRELRHSPSRTSQMVPSGGSVRLKEFGRP